MGPSPPPNPLNPRRSIRVCRSYRGSGRCHHRAERRYGTFARSFVLPRDVDADGIQAAFEDGVLTVRIPKSEKARRRKIDVGGMASTQQVGGGEQGQNGNGNQQNG